MSSKVILWVAGIEMPPPELKHFSIRAVSEVSVALPLLASDPPEALVAWFPLAEWTPDDFLLHLQRISPDLPVILVDPYGGTAEAVRLTRMGAFYYLGQGTNFSEVLNAIEGAVQYRQAQRAALASSQADNEPWRKWLVGESRPMQKIIELIRLVGARRCTVLISGETGTGKEMVARALHMASPRAYRPMVTVNCSALPENLLEAELFGHVKGAFTGAVTNRMGRFEQADGSTLFLDEIGDLPLELQVKLLRVLQEREFQRLGSSETVRVNIRVIAATNLNLLKKIEQGLFREDLYYRLNVVPIYVPPLRERISDIPLLVHYFIDKICRLENIPTKRIGPETLDRLCSFAWPGNVRQLENAVEMAVALSGDRGTLYPSDFPLPTPTAWKASVQAVPSITLPDQGIDFEQMVANFERSLLEQALKKTGGNKQKAANMLRLKRTTLSAKLRSLQNRPACAAWA